jgi:hypothetical protein
VYILKEGAAFLSLNTFELSIPLGCQNGWLTMLTAYFDDSGTHDGSEIVAVAGIMGSESELLSLEGLWREQLDRPLDGLKSPIAEFHAYDCFESKGEFSGWKRAETDYLRHRLRKVIIASHVSAYGIAYVKEDWDNIIKGEIRDLLGTAEGNAVRNCFVRTLRWAESDSYDPDITFIFDDSDSLEGKRDIRAVYEAFRRHNKQKHLSGLTFMNSRKIMPLQAADMFAWEFNRNAHDILEKGVNTSTTREIVHLRKGMQWLDAQIARKEQIAALRDFTLKSLPPGAITQMSDHFKNFAPVLSGKKKMRLRLAQTQSRRPLDR